MSTFTQTRHGVAVVAAIAMLLTACTDTSNVEEAAESFVAPAEWTLEESDTAIGFETIYRHFKFSSDQSRDEACAAAALALARWANIDISEINERTTDRGCTRSTGNVFRINGEDIWGSINIYPARVDDVVTEDSSEAGGIGLITFDVSQQR